jgi:hypothetical protein
MAERNVSPKTKYTATIASSKLTKTRGSPCPQAARLIQDIPIRAAVIATAM